MASLSPYRSGLQEITAQDYGHALLSSMGVGEPLLAALPADNRSASALWADSGAMALTGLPDGAPLHSPAPLAACAQGAWLALSTLCPEHFASDFAAYRLLGERAALFGYKRQGDRSPGGSCRLLSCADAILAINLARDDDFELLPAWLQTDVHDWEGLAAELPDYPAALLLERARLLGLAVAVSSAPACDGPGHSADPASWFRQTPYGARRRPTSADEQPLVVDLSSLWAGPLCGQLLAQSGARVIKVEGLTRADGARTGSPAFFDLMNSGKECVALDLTSEKGQRQLYRLLELADIVIESTRPRALEQMQINAEPMLAQRPGKVWLSITGYGRCAPNRDWIAYGDDAGVAAGLSQLMEQVYGQPLICGDAIADPLTGLHSAVLARHAWHQGGGVLLDVALRDVVNFGAGFSADPRLCQPDLKSYPVSPPVARRAPLRAGELGRDTQAVCREFGL